VVLPSNASAAQLLSSAALKHAAKVRSARLRKLKLFVLDNSVRESTVAQTRGHTLQDKHRIME
jgi:hypothetical protein